MYGLSDSCLPSIRAPWCPRSALASFASCAQLPRASRRPSFCLVCLKPDHSTFCLVLAAGVIMRLLLLLEGHRCECPWHHDHFWNASKLEKWKLPKGNRWAKSGREWRAPLLEVLIKPLIRWSNSAFFLFLVCFGFHSAHSVVWGWPYLPNYWDPRCEPLHPAWNSSWEGFLLL